MYPTTFPDELIVPVADAPLPPPPEKVITGGAKKFIPLVTTDIEAIEVVFKLTIPTKPVPVNGVVIVTVGDVGYFVKPLEVPPLIAVIVPVVDTVAL